jgi:hypothetical protein
LQVQQFGQGEGDVAELVDRLATEAIQNEVGRLAWQSLIRAHATLMRQLATDPLVGRALPSAARRTRITRKW